MPITQSMSLLLSSARELYDWSSAIIVLETLQRGAVKQEIHKDAVKCLITTFQGKGNGGKGFFRSICIKSEYDFESDYYRS